MAIQTLPAQSIPITTPLRPGLVVVKAPTILAAAIFAPWLSPHDPLLLAPAQRLKPATAQFLLGTDGYGRDVLSRILYGGPLSLLIGLRAALLSIRIRVVVCL